MLQLCASANLDPRCHDSRAHMFVVRQPSTRNFASLGCPADLPSNVRAGAPLTPQSSQAWPPPRSRREVVPSPRGWCQPRSHSPRRRTSDMGIRWRRILTAVRPVTYCTISAVLLGDQHVTLSRPPAACPRNGPSRIIRNSVPGPQEPSHVSLALCLVSTIRCMGQLCVRHANPSTSYLGPGSKLCDHWVWLIHHHSPPLHSKLVFVRTKGGRAKHFCFVPRLRQ